MTDSGQHLQAAMMALDESFNGPKPKEAVDASWRKIGLVLFAFPYGDQSGVANYVSNGADRRDMIKFLRETADRFERQVADEDSKTRDDILGADIKGIVGDEIDRLGADSPTPEVVDVVSRRLADEGRIIEAGWQGFRRMFFKPTTPAGRLREARLSFMAGAQHLFASVIEIMDRGENEEPTENDLRRMDLINNELLAFAKETYGK